MKKRIQTAVVLMVMGLAMAGCGGNSGSSHPAKLQTQEFKSDDEFLDYIQKVHFNYMWEGAGKVSGLAPERIHLDDEYPDNDADVMATGGSGFGLAGLVVAMERGFITRSDGVERLSKIVDFLGKAQRFHGAWPHWINDADGTVKPFGYDDDGGDLVETSFLAEGLVIVREYLKDGSAVEKELASNITGLLNGIEWDWYQQGAPDKLYWHWSPKYQWVKDFAIEGYNECLITYILGASSPTHPINPEAYHKCWARDGGIVSDSEFFGLPLILNYNGNPNHGGPLFWSHYSYIGLCPKGLKDRYADYWQLVCNHARTDYLYCVSNPLGHKGYGENCWGLTASYSPDGYAAHQPYTEDLGVITPTAALSSFPYTPKESMAALRHFYFDMRAVWGKYGFFDAFCVEKSWYPMRYLAIDQCTIAPMIENYRTGLLWKLFMGAPEIRQGLETLGFTYTPQI